MASPRARQRLAVTAIMSDGSTRDVTDKVLFSSNDDAVAEVDQDGNVQAKRPGETAIMVRYLGQVAVSRVRVLPPWKLDRYPDVPRVNYVDELVQAKLRKLRVVPSGLCTDEEFVRRRLPGRARHHPHGGGGPVSSWRTPRGTSAPGSSTATWRVPSTSTSGR